MSDKYLVTHCSPTLAGLKTANLFSAGSKSSKEITRELRRLNRLITKKGLRAVPVKTKNGRILIYLYRPDYLARDLSDPLAKSILSERGYLCDSPERCITQLINRMESGEEFPHEIGLFLGYPPTDVKCFMEDPYSGVQCSGCWKAYGNRKEAEQTFKRYKKCVGVYCRRISEGRQLKDMIVKTCQEA